MPSCPVDTKQLLRGDRTKSVNLPELYFKISVLLSPSY